jgi:hypothetical protein
VVVRGGSGIGDGEDRSQDVVRGDGMVEGVELMGEEAEAEAEVVEVVVGVFRY